MKEGYWINPKTGQKWEVQEHCIFAKSPAGAAAMGLPPRVQEEIKGLSCDYTDGSKEREGVVIAVMKAGFMRMRGHGMQYSFEFWGNTRDNLWAVLAFCQQMAGPYTHIVINNLKSNEQFAANFQDFEARMKRDEEEVLRIATQLVKNPALAATSVGG